MDLGAFRRSRAKAIEEDWAAAPDYPMLVATLAALQAASAAARAASRPAAVRALDASAEPIVDILTAAPSWRDSVAAQGGCFHRPSFREDR